MIRALTGILLFTVLTSTALAGPAGKGNGPCSQGQGARMAHIQQALGLSQEQAAQIRKIRQNGGGREQVRAVLTEEQRALMDEHRSAKRGRGAQGPGPCRANGNRDTRAPAPEEPGTG